MPERQRTKEGWSRADDRRAGTSIRILVVDDEPSILRFFQAVLGWLNYTVAVAANGELALRLAETQAFDLAFVDCVLEEANGADVARKLRELQPKLKIVLMSGYVVSDKAAAMETAGASMFLVKPFSAENAQGIVARLLHCIPGQRAGGCDKVFGVGYEAATG